MKTLLCIVLLSFSLGISSVFADSQSSSSHLLTPAVHHRLLSSKALPTSAVFVSQDEKFNTLPSSSETSKKFPQIRTWMIISLLALSYIHFRE